MPQPYNPDFPELVIPPAETYQQTIQSQYRYDPKQSEMVLINIHRSVLYNVERLQRQLRLTIPAKIDDESVQAAVPEGLKSVFDDSRVYIAVIHRIGELLRGEMDIPDQSIE